jgi:hypothetical protein
MNYLDDNHDLVDELSAGIAERMAEIHAPEGLAHEARRIARRRTTTRALGAGLPALAVVGALGALVAASGSSGTAATGSLRVIGPRAPAPPLTAQDTAYVVRRVRARLAVAASRRGVVLSTLNKTSYPVHRTVTYLEPRTQIFYQNDTAYARQGRELFANVDADIPSGNYMHFRALTVSYSDHTWAQEESVASEPFQQHPRLTTRPLAPGALSRPSAVEKALSSHLATRVGTTKLDGIPVLVLKGRAGQDHITLYVDAQTYQPLRETEHARGKFPLDTITDVLPATTANIAWARNPPKIPPGYTRTRPTS